MEEKMRKLKKLLPALMAIVMALALVFSVACSGSCKPDNNSDNGGQETVKPEVNDVAEVLQDVAINTDSVKKTYVIGEKFSSAGLVVTASVLVTETNQTETRTVTSDAVVDSTAFRSEVGNYTIYVTYRLGTVSLTRNYTVAVTAPELNYGGISVELAEGKEEKYTLSSSQKEVTLDKTMVKVYTVDDEGAKSEEPLADTAYTTELYLGTEKVANNVAADDGVYLIVVTVTESGEQSFLSVPVANPLESIAFKSDAEGTVTSQPRGKDDLLTSTWKFTATYANELTKDVSFDKNAGFKSDFNPLTSSEGDGQEPENYTPYDVTVTYTVKDAFGTDNTKTATVQVTVTPNTETLVIDYAWEASGGVTLSPDDLFVAGDNTVKAYGNGTLGSGSKNVTFSDKKSLSNRNQFNKTKGAEITVEGPAAITVYYISGNSSVATIGFYKVEGSETLLATGTNTQTDPVVYTFIAPTAGTYKLHAHADSAASSCNVYAINITTLIAPPKGDPIEAYTVTFNENHDGATTTETVLGYEGYNVAKGYTPERAGYTFEGWYTAATEGTPVTFPLTVEEDTTVYAHWVENEVEDITATKTTVSYTLVNSSVEIKTDDIEVKSSAGSALSASWAVTYELYKDSECSAANKVTGFSVESSQDYYLKVIATKSVSDGEPIVKSKVITVTVAEPDEIVVTPATKTVQLSGEGSVTVEAASLNLMVKAAGVELDGDVWTYAYELKNEGGETQSGDSSWTLTATGAYTLTVKAYKTVGGSVENALTAEVTINVNPASESAQGSLQVNTGSGKSFQSIFDPDDSATGNKDDNEEPTYELGKDDHLTITANTQSGKGIRYNPSQQSAIGGVTFAKGRMGTNGESRTDRRAVIFKFTTDVKSATIIIYAASATSGQTRYFGLFTTANAPASSVSTTPELIQALDAGYYHGFDGAEAWTISLESIVSDGTYYLLCNNGMNIYGISVSYEYTTGTVSVAEPYVYNFNNLNITTDSQPLTTGSGEESYTLIQKSDIGSEYITSDFVIHTHNKATKIKYKDTKYTVEYSGQSYQSINGWQPNGSTSGAWLTFTLASGNYDVIMYYAQTAASPKTLGKPSYKINGSASYTTADSAPVNGTTIVSYTIEGVNGGEVSLGGSANINIYAIVIVPKA